MTSESEISVGQINHDFKFLTEQYGFQAGAPRLEGEVTRVEYRHPHVTIEFTLRHGEWHALAWPTLSAMRANQVKLEDIALYLTRPSIDVAADQTRPGLTQSQALAQLAGQLAPVAAQMVALFEPGPWPETWVDLQKVLKERGAERSRQFAIWWQQQAKKPRS